MNALLRKVVSRSRYSLLKESLQTQLMACVKDIQLDQAHCGAFQSSLEAAEALCSILEAIFIHGIKETLASRMAIAIGDLETKPEPNFWPALLVFSHREIIEQIGKLNFVSTDVGRCRAWLRMALNEAILSSYLQSMLAQNSALNSFYMRDAFLRDRELLDTFITLISGIESYPFNLACNSSLLNLWTNEPLLMSGIWSPAMKSCPITSGTDIASTLTGQDVMVYDKDSLSSVASVSSFYESSPRSSAFDEDEALKRILGTNQGDSYKIPENSVNDSETQSEPPVADDSVEAAESPIVVRSKTDVEFADNKSVPEKELLKTERESRTEESTVPSVFAENEVKVEHRKLQSYHSLVENYNQTSTTISKVPDLQDLLQKFHKTKRLLDPPSIISDSETMDNLDFEVVPDNFNPSDLPEFGMFIQQISRIATEQGLNSQDYICKRCSEHVGVNFREAKVCGLTGTYYCSECYGTDPAQELWIIPARVMYNWDFRRYSVSSNAALFLSQTQHYPLFDISVINEKIYGAVEEMAKLKEIRVRLKFLGDYLRACRENTFEGLQRLLWPRDYLYENLHHYSLADLIQVPSGALEGALLKAVEFARNHVLSCSFCVQQGFICELCRDPKIIFPFDLESTYRCEVCGTLYHTKCLQPGQSCRKCVRIQQRELQRSTVCSNSNSSTGNTQPSSTHAIST